MGGMPASSQNAGQTVSKHFLQKSDSVRGKHVHRTADSSTDKDDNRRMQLAALVRDEKAEHILIAVLSVVMGVAVKLTQWLLGFFVTYQSGQLHAAIVVFVCAAVGGAVYMRRQSPHAAGRFGT